MSRVSTVLRHLLLHVVITGYSDTSTQIGLKCNIVTKINACLRACLR